MSPPPRTRLWKLAALMLGSAVAAHLAATAVGPLLWNQKGGDPTPNFQRPRPHPVTDDGQSFDFGEVWEAPDHLVRVPVHNRRGGSLDVTDVTASCGCTHVSPTRFSVSPHVASPVDVRIDLTKRAHHAIGQLDRPFHASLTLVGRYGEPVERVNVHGRVKRRLVLDEPDLHFGESCAANTAARPRSVVITCRDQSVTPRVSVQPEGFVRCQLTPLGETRHRLSVTPVVSLPAGDYAGEVVISAELADWTLATEAKLPVSFRLMSSPLPEAPTAEESK